MSLILSIKRFAYLPRGTYGIAKIDGSFFQCFTVEQPWRDNLPFRSCVPEGTYNAIRHGIHHASGTGKGHFALVNPDHDVFNNEGDIPPEIRADRRGRFKCLVFDVANHPAEVQGCVAAGALDKYMWYSPRRMVDEYLSITNSRSTVAEFNEITKNEDRLKVVIDRFRGSW